MAWWAKDGLSVPGNVGHHIHLRLLNFPAEGRIVNGTYVLRVRVVLHDQVGSVTSIRYGDESTVQITVPFTLAGCHDCSKDIDIPVDFSKWPTGRREFRLSAFVDDEQPDGLPGSDPGPQRMFPSSGYQVCVRACTPSYRSGFHTEARGWYQDHEYANAKITTALASIKPGATVGVRMSPGAGGLPTKNVGAFIDPNFHAGSAGLELPVCVSGTCLTGRTSEVRAGTVRIPSLEPGTHRLVLVSSDGKNAGVLAYAFVVVP